VFLAIVIGGSLTLYRMARAEGGPGRRLRPVLARDAAACQQRAAARTAAATVLLGTLYPLFLDALGLGKISVGPPYFEAVFVPLMRRRCC
jgi:cytochrome c-type biogenesis protein CcmF